MQQGASYFVVYALVRYWASGKELDLTDVRRRVFVAAATLAYLFYRSFHSQSQLYSLLLIGVCGYLV
jgi:hypothetical protein